MRNRLLFWLLIFMLAACGGDGQETAVPPTAAPQAEAATAAPTAEPGVVRVGVSPDGSSFIAGEGRGFVGFDVDLMTAVAEAAGLEVVFEETPWPPFQRLADGELDAAVSAITITEDRRSLVDFTQPYFDAGQAIAVRPGSSVSGLGDLAEQPVGVQQGTTAESFMRAESGADVVVYDEIIGALQALALGEVTAVVYDRLPLVSLVQGNPELNLALLNAPLTEEQYGIAVSKARPEVLAALNEGLSAVQSAGAYGEICARWFGADDACLTGVAAQAAAAATPTTDGAAPSVSGDTLFVPVLYGSEKREWLEPLVREFNQVGFQTSDGRIIVIEAQPMGSIAAATAVLSGTEEAVVWMPASSIYLPTLEADWQAQYGTSLSTETPPSVLRSPVIIAMWQPMAELLGWPEAALGWQTIADLSGQNWADLGGDAAWGSFKFGHTHPEHSNSGLSAVLAEIYAGAGKQQGLTLADMEDTAVRSFVSRIEGSIIDYGSSTGFFADRMFNCEIGGPAYLSAAVLYENLVATQPEVCPDQPPLVAIYPTEGTFITDHPFVVLNAPWVSVEQKAAALTFQSFLLSEAAQRQAPAAGFRPVAEAITLTAPLDAANGVDPTQPATVLAAPEPAVVQAVASVWREAKRAADILMLVDISNSMWGEDVAGQGSKIAAAQRGLNEFVALLGDGDRLQVMTFNSEMRTLTALTAVGEKRTAVQEAILDIRPESHTRLYDAVIEAYQALQATGDGNRIRAIVLLSDGRDERLLDGLLVQASENEVSDVLTTIQMGADGGNAIKIFPIAYGQEADVEILSHVAETSGGKLFQAGVDTVEQVYEEIATFFN